jgi:hypothetical protein
MDPVTGVVVKVGASWLGSKFKTLVIDRWVRRRAEAFFETFVEELAANDETGQPFEYATRGALADIRIFRHSPGPPRSCCGAGSRACCLRMTWFFGELS